MMLKRLLYKVSSLAVVASLLSALLSGCVSEQPSVIPTQTSTVSTSTQSVDTEIPESKEPDTPPTKTPEDTYVTPVPVTEENPAISITELMILNTVGIKDGTGKCAPWIEFYNQSSQSVDLSQYKIVFEDKGECLLPAIEILPGEYAVVFANGIEGENSISITPAYQGKITVFHGDKITARVNYTNRNANYSYLTSNGSETAQPTPGYETAKQPDNLVVSELMSTNSLFPIDGVDCDWIEILNLSEDPVDLSNYYITTDVNNPYAHKVPSVVLERGEYLIIACGRDVEFNLSKDGESVYITRNDGVLATSLTFEAMEKNTSYTYDKGVVDYPSPGYPNTVEGSMLSINDRVGLVINEVISSNKIYNKFNGKYCDIVELYNNSDAPLRLSDYYLSDKGSDLTRYRLPEVNVWPGEYYIVYCDSEVEGAAPFGISASGENLFLSKADGYLADALSVPAIPQNRSWGRSGDKLVYFTIPTIGNTNGEGHDSVTPTPAASVVSGIYSQPQTVTLSGEGTIYYTLDGSKPTINSAVYNGEEFLLEKTTAIRAIAYDGDRIPSDMVTYNYLINIPEYELPIVKISVAHDDLFAEDGIYTDYLSKEEKEANCTFFVNGIEEFSINCGIKINGEYSRKYTKKSFQLEFRSKYGSSRLEYPLFEGSDVTSFDNIVLRSGSQSLMASETMFTDEFVTSLAVSLGQMENLLVQAYRPCNLYINDEYFGVYFIRERVDADFVADHCGISPESVTVVRWTKTLDDGSSWQGWDQLWNSIYPNVKDYSLEENYRPLADQINLNSLIDLIIMRMYAGDVDYNNVRCYKSPEFDNGRWNFILHDNDLSFQRESYLEDRLDVFLNSSSTEKSQALFRALMENQEFRILFMQRFSMHIQNTLTAENITSRIDGLVKELEHDMPYQIDRWKDDSFYLETMNEWNYTIKRLRYRSGQFRIDLYIKDVISTLELTDEQIKEYLGEQFLEYKN